MGRRRIGARVHGFPTSFPSTWPVGSRSQVLETMEGVSGLLPVLLSPAGRSRVLWLAGKFRFTIREERDDGQHVGRFRIPTRVCLRVTTERQRSTRLGEGSTRSQKGHGESASSTLKKASVERCAGSRSAEAGGSE
jgi:hypothetical protein